MRVGKLDQRIGLYSLSESNVSGELTQVYALVATVFGQVISQRGNEAFEVARTNARETIRVCIHYRTDVTNKWQITWEGQTYNVINTDRSNRRDGELWITAQVVGAI